MKEAVIQPEVLQQGWRVECGEHGLIGVFAELEPMEEAIVIHQTVKQCQREQINIKLIKGGEIK